MERSFNSYSLYFIFAFSNAAWFTPYLGGVDRKAEDYYRKLAQNLKRTLVFNNGLSLIGLLRSCLDYALNDTAKIAGVFEALQTQVRFQGGRKVLETVTRINDFRNTYIAHQEQELQPFLID